MALEFAEEVVVELRRLRHKARGRRWLLQNDGYRRQRRNAEARAQRLLGFAAGLATAGAVLRRVLARRIDERPDDPA